MVIVFDVNETLLDLGALDGPFARLYGDALARDQWFGLLKELWLTATATDRYEDFGALAEAALEGTARLRGIEVEVADRRAIVEAIMTLPPHPETANALALLQGAGHRLAALTNGTPEALGRQLSHAGLDAVFEQALSVDAVRCYKPARAPYAFAARRMGVELGAMWMVAAHGWDVAGAAAAGCRTAFVAREGAAAHPNAPAPDVTGADLLDVARQLVAHADGAA